MEYDRQFFATIDHFLPFNHTNDPKKKKIWKKYKRPGDIILLHMCTIN